jgi:hypothetical protein
MTGFWSNEAGGGVERDGDGDAVGGCVVGVDAGGLAAFGVDPVGPGAATGRVPGPVAELEAGAEAGDAARRVGDGTGAPGVVATPCAPGAASAVWASRAEAIGDDADDVIEGIAPVAPGESDAELRITAETVTAPSKSAAVLSTRTAATCRPCRGFFATGRRAARVRASPSGSEDTRPTATSGRAGEGDPGRLCRVAASGGSARA